VSPATYAWLLANVHSAWQLFATLGVAVGFVLAAVLVSQAHWFRAPVRAPVTAPKTRARAYWGFLVDALLHSLIVFLAWSFGDNAEDSRVPALQSALFGLSSARYALRVLYLYCGGALRRFIVAAVLAALAWCIVVAELGLVFRLVPTLGAFFLLAPLLVASYEFTVVVHTTHLNWRHAHPSATWFVAVLAPTPKLNEGTGGGSGGASSSSSASSYDTVAMVTADGVLADDSYITPTQRANAANTGVATNSKQAV
jgi:hypothetical protein